MNKVEIGIMATATRVNSLVNCKARTETVTKKSGVIRRLEILTSKHLKIITLPTQLSGNMGITTSENTVKELQCVISARKRGILSKDAPLRP